MKRKRGKSCGGEGMYTHHISGPLSDLGLEGLEGMLGGETLEFNFSNMSDSTFVCDNGEEFPDDPRDYEWSSYAYYAHGKMAGLIRAPREYMALGCTEKRRQEKYRAMVDVIIKNDLQSKGSRELVPLISDPIWVLDRYQELSCVDFKANASS